MKKRNYINLPIITPVNKKIITEAKNLIDNKTKPPGSLGRLEDLAIKICTIQNSLSPSVTNKSLFVFAADHGISEEMVSAYPKEVTAQMVLNFLKGGAAINVFCRQFGIDLKVIDMGVDYDFNYNDILINKKINKGTRNFLKYEAMSYYDVIKALNLSIDYFFQCYANNKIDIIGLGEMGIGNTTSASAIISIITNSEVEKVTGYGTGIDDQKLKHKINIIKQAIEFHKVDNKDGIEILQKVGGYEIAGIVGTILAAASKQTVIVLDGIISTAAGLIAYLINPFVRNYIIIGHRSVEYGQYIACKFMRLKPIIDLSMRLGEGTGAAITINLCETACRIVNEMASFEEANVTKKL